MPGALDQEPPAQANVPWYQSRTIVYILLVLFFPAGLYGLWKNTSFTNKQKWILTGLTLLLWMVLANVSGTSGSDAYKGGDCSDTFQENGCTYFRDSTCNVIAVDCN